MPAVRTHVRAGRWAAVGLALTAALLLPACSINPDWQLARGDAPATAVLLDVPFHPQTEYQCGPAALATVLGASGVATSPEALVPQVYLPGREGSLQMELVAATRRAGRIPYEVERDPEGLLAEATRIALEAAAPGGVPLGLLLGVMTLPYTRGRVTLEGDDVLAIFTDGVTEAMGEAEEEYGEERLERVLLDHRTLPVQALLGVVRRAIDEFTGSPELLSDDLTAIFMRIPSRA